jgi:hypothetical protein
MKSSLVAVLILALFFIIAVTLFAFDWLSLQVGRFVIWVVSRVMRL